MRGLEFLCRHDFGRGGKDFPPSVPVPSLHLKSPLNKPDGNVRSKAVTETFLLLVAPIDDVFAF